MLLKHMPEWVIEIEIRSIIKTDNTQFGFIQRHSNTDVTFT